MSVPKRWNSFSGRERDAQEIKFRIIWCCLKTWPDVKGWRDFLGVTWNFYFLGGNFLTFTLLSPIPVMVPKSEDPIRSSLVPQAFLSSSFMCGDTCGDTVVDPTQFLPVRSVQSGQGNSMTRAVSSFVTLLGCSATFSTLCSDAWD